MNEYPLSKFIDLIEYDQSIVAAEKEKTALQHDLHKHKNEFDVLQTSLENAKLHLHEVRKEVDVKEREMADLDEQEKRKKERLENATSQREYESLKHEIEAIKKKQHGLEEGLVAVWRAFEIAQKETEEKKTFCVQRSAQLDVVIQEIMKKIEVIDAKIEELLGVRSQKEEGIPGEWLEKYASMRLKVSNPVVPVQNGSCSACFYQVSQKDLAELRKNKLIVCRDCFRLLYLERPSKEASVS
jgi:predicted  nucleic acid-binding Zn-ribbon protein